MQRTVKYILYTLAAVFFVSCGDGVSLQRYYVDHQETKDFIAQDIPISLMQLDKSKFTEEQQEAYNSVKKLNFLGYRSSDSDLKVYNAEIEKVKTILSNDEYQDLIEFSDRGRKVVVKYVGDDESADEVVIFGSAEDLGFGIVRVLGDDMKPEKIGVLINSLRNANLDQSQIQDIMNFFE